MDSSPLLDPIGTEPGAYLLAIDLAGELPLDIAALGPGASLAPGRYVYCGSAYGPGGMRARVARHLRQDKTPRWHVDRLTLTGRVVETGALAGGSECDLCAGLRALPGVRVPLLGFGSSDCRTCPAHLLAVPADFAVGEFLSGFRSPV